MQQPRLIVGERIEPDSWVVDGNYRSLVQDIVFAKVDTVVWLDLPRRVVMPRITRRTLGRMVLRRELWNGNRERFAYLFKTTPEDNIILWSWTQHDKYRQQYLHARDDAANAHLNWIHLTSRQEVRGWIATLPEDQPQQGFSRRSRRLPRSRPCQRWLLTAGSPR